MDDEHDDDREREEHAEAEMPAEFEDGAATEDRENLEPPVPEEPVYTPPEESVYTPPEESIYTPPEEPVYTPEEYQLAEQIKARRLYKEENGRIPYTASELSHFLMKGKIELPLTPDDEDLAAARSKLEAGDS